MKKKSFGQRLKTLFSFAPNTDEFYEELEEILIEADLGAAFTMQLSDQLRDAGKIRTREDLQERLEECLLREIRHVDLGLDPTRLNVVLMLGVNGVGKTTNLAKLASYYQRTWPDQGIVLAAGDTFRAAAVEQLTLHAQRLGVRIVKQSSGSDAGAVVWDALDSAKARGDRLLLVDTAGRMHNRKDLIHELEKIHQIVARKAGDGVVYRKVLVVDATTGQNALQQAQLFHEAVTIDSVLLSKYDSSARGGVLVPIARQVEVGCSFLGVGEHYEDLLPFDAQRYVKQLVAP